MEKYMNYILFFIVFLLDAYLIGNVLCCLVNYPGNKKLLKKYAVKNHKKDNKYPVVIFVIALVFHIILIL